MLPSSGAVCKLPVWGMAGPHCQALDADNSSGFNIVALIELFGADVLEDADVLRLLRQLAWQTLGRLHAERAQHLHLAHQVAAPARQLVEGCVVCVARLLDASAKFAQILDKAGEFVIEFRAAFGDLLY